jgi:hypothetical protein
VVGTSTFKYIFFSGRIGGWRAKFGLRKLASYGSRSLQKVLPGNKQTNKQTNKKIHTNRNKFKPKTQNTPTFFFFFFFFFVCLFAIPQLAQAAVLPRRGGAP